MRLLPLLLALCPALAVALPPKVLVTGQVVDPSNGAPTKGTLTCKLSVPGATADGSVVAAESTTTLVAGAIPAGWGLVPNDAMTPTGTKYTCTISAVLANGRPVQAVVQKQLASSPSTIAFGAIPDPGVKLNAVVPAPPPTITPAAGTYTSAQSVVLTGSASGCSFYVTTDGSTPTTASAGYSGPITASTSQTVKAISSCPGYQVGTVVASAAYVINTYQGQPAGCYASGSSIIPGLYPVTFARASAATYPDANGAWQSCPSGYFRALPFNGGYTGEVAIQQFVTAPYAPGTETQSLTTGSYVAWMEGPGSLAVATSGATATGLPCTSTGAYSGTCFFTVTVAGNVTWTPSGIISLAQIQKYPIRAAAITTATTKAADVASFPTPALTLNNYCIGVTIHTPNNGLVRSQAAPAYSGYGGNKCPHQIAVSVGAYGSASDIDFLIEQSGEVQWNVYDGAGLTKYVSYTLNQQAGEQDSLNRLWGRNNGGTLTLSVNGTPHNSLVLGAGTGLGASILTPTYIGNSQSGLHSCGFGISDIYFKSPCSDTDADPYPDPAIRIDGLGDSISAGNILNFGYPEILGSPAWLGQRYRVINSGVAGNTTAQILARWTSTVSGLGASRLVLQGGTNDILINGLTDSVAWGNLKTIVDQALAAGMRVVVMTMPPCKGHANWNGTVQGYINALNTSIRSYVPSVNPANYVVYDLNADLNDGADAIKAQLDIGDHVHPNYAGQVQIANRLKPLLQ